MHDNILTCRIEILYIEDIVSPGQRNGGRIASILALAGICTVPVYRLDRCKTVENGVKMFRNVFTQDSICVNKIKRLITDLMQQ